MSALPPPMHDRDGKIWMDGELVDWRDAKIHVLSHTLHYGCGAFEGVRAYDTANGTAIFRLQEHTERLFNSAKILRMKIPFTQQEVMDAQRAVVRENNLFSDIDLFEINEAFASVLMKFLRDTRVPWDKVNVNGGACALGHPIGATGSILIGTVLDELERRGLKRGLVTMCAAGGMAPAIIIERV